MKQKRDLTIFKKNIFGQQIFVKRLIIRLFGTIVYARFNWRYKTEIEGSEVFQELPENNVLIISNHQTYFADVAFFYHVIYSSLAGSPNNIKRMGFLRPRKHQLYYIAAEETMKSGFLPKLLALSGAVTVQRSWRASGQNVRRKVSKKDTENIDRALKDGWVITFPQGTTSAFAPGRVGTAIIAKQHKAIVVPVVIDGFRRAFDKKGLKTKKTGTKLKMRVKEPMNIDYTKPVEEILLEMMTAIEQTKDFLQIGKNEGSAKSESLNDR